MFYCKFYCSYDQSLSHSKSTLIMMMMTTRTMITMMMAVRVTVREDTNQFVSAVIDAVEVSGDVLVVVEDIFQVLNVIRVSAEQ